MEYTREPKLVEKTLGLRVQGSVFAPLLYKGDKLGPVGKSLEFETNKDDQQSLKIAIFRGEEVTTDHEGCEFVAEFDVMDLPKRPRSESTFIVTFTQETVH